MSALASAGLSTLLFIQTAVVAPAVEVEPPSESTTSTAPDIADKAEQPLSAAIAAFNQSAALDHVGKTQPLLTEEELICSIRSIPSKTKLPTLSRWDVEELLTLVRRRTIPSRWQFEFTTEIEGLDGERFRVWLTRLVRVDEDGNKSNHQIRRQFITELDEQKNPKPLPTREANPGLKAIPLAEAIDAFNVKHPTAGGVRMEPITEEEVISAIRWWKTKKDDAPVSEKNFARFQEISATRQMPEDGQFELIERFQSGGPGNVRVIWSVRLRMPNGQKEGWTYAFNIREHHIRSERFEDLQISWGPADFRGLQVGVRLEPAQPEYHVGQRVIPVFYVRNTRGTSVSARFARPVSFPATKIFAGDSTGKAIPIEFSNGRNAAAPPNMEFSIQAESHVEIRGLPLVFGKIDMKQLDTALLVEPGQSVRLRFAMPSANQNDPPSYRTGEIRLSIQK